MTGEIFTRPQPNSGAIINCIDCDYRIRIREGDLARRNCRRRCSKNKVVKGTLGVWCSQIVLIPTPAYSHVKGASGQARQPFEQIVLTFSLNASTE